MTTAAQGQGSLPVRTTTPPGISTPVAPQPQIEKTRKQEIETSTNQAAVHELKKMKPLPTIPAPISSHITTDIPRKGTETAQIGIPTLLHHPVLGQASTSTLPLMGTPQQHKELENAKNQERTELNHTNSLKAKKEEIEKKPELTSQDRKEIAKLENALQLSAVNSSKASIKVILAEASIRGTATTQDRSKIADYLLKGREAHKAYTESSLKLIRNDITAIKKNAENNPEFANEAKGVTLKYNQLETQHRTIRATEHRLFSPENALLDSKIRSLNGDINALPGALKADPPAPKPATKPLPTPPSSTSKSAPLNNTSPVAPTPPPIPQINLKEVLAGNAKETATKIDTNIKPSKETFNARTEELPSTTGTREAPLAKERRIVADAEKTMEAVHKANGKRDGKIVVTEESFKAGDRSLFSAFHAKVESMVRFSDIKALQKANQSLDEGIAAQTKITANAKAAWDKNPNNAALESDFKKERATLQSLQNSKVTLNNLKWAQGVLHTQTYRVSTQRDLDNATAAIRQTQAELNVHTPTPRFIIDEAATAPPIGRFENLNATNNQIKNLITGSDPNVPATQTQLNTLNDQNKALLKEAVDEATKPIRYPITPTPGLNNTQAAIDRDLSIKTTADRVGAEASSVSKSVANDPELKAHADALKSAYDNKKTQLDKGNLSPEGKDAVLKDLRNISESLAMVENQHIHKQEAAALSTPEQISARAATQEASELNQLKGILEAIKKDPKTKIVRYQQDQRIAKQGGRLSGAEGPEGTANYILGKIPTDLTHPDVNKAAKEVIELVKSDPKLSYAINSDPTRAALLKKIEDNIKDTVITEAKINVNNRLLDPPADATFQRAFLTSYRSVAKEFTGDERKNVTESTKLFNYVNSTLKDPQVPLYAKQQLLKLTDEWINEPFINSGEVATHIDNLKEIAKTAANEGSPSLKTLSEKIVASLPKDKPATVAKTETTTATQALEREQSEGKITNVSMLISQVTNGDIKIGSKEYQNAINGLAKSMTAQSAATFTALTAADFKNDSWGEKNIKAMISESENVAYFVAESIIASKVSDSNPKDMQKNAAKTIEVFVDLLQALSSPNNGPVNMNLQSGILTGLGMQSVGRLTNAFDRLPSDKQKALNASKEQFDPSNGFKNLRSQMKELKDNNTPVIPSIVMHLPDLTGVLTVVPSTYEGTKQVNGDKVNTLAKILSDINGMQKNIPTTTKPTHDLSDINGKAKAYSEPDLTKELNDLNASKDKLLVNKEQNKTEIDKIDARIKEIQPGVDAAKANLNNLFSNSRVIQPPQG